jgi:hypothetical protein
VKRALLRFLRLAERPEAPPGAGPTLQVFRASRRQFQLQAALWGLRQLVTAVGIVVSLIFLGAFEAAATGMRTNPALERLAERVFDLSWGELQTRFVQVWPYVALIEGLAIAGFVLNVWLGWSFLRLDWEARWYMVSDESLRIREGLFRTHERTMTVANIQNLSVRRGPVQKLLRIADLEVHSAGGGARPAGAQGRRQSVGADLHVGRFRGVDDAEGLRARIQAAMLRHRDSGLGDPDDVHPPALAEVGQQEAAQVAAPTTADQLEAAARELRDESRRLHQAIAAFVAVPWP